MKPDKNLLPDLLVILICWLLAIGLAAALCMKIRYLL